MRITSPRDFYGGLALVALAAFSFYAGWSLPGLEGSSFGPGTAPRLFGGLLLIVGLAITLFGFFVDGPAVERQSLRSTFFVVAAVLCFAFLIRPMGLVVTCFLTFMVGSAASSETRWAEAAIVAVLLTAFCVFLFAYLLRLPFQWWPGFLF